MLFAVLAAVAFGGECDGQVNAQCSSCTWTANCAWMVGSSTCLPIGNAAVLKAYKADSSSVKTKHSGCGGARSIENRIARLVTELSAPNDMDFAPSTLKGRLARDMCFSDCYAYNGNYDFDHCWQYQPCYENCLQACLNADTSVTYGPAVAALDEHLTKTRRGVVSYGSELDFAPSALKGRLARDMCFSDCYAKNGVAGNWDNCWQQEPCRDNCIQACIDASPQVTYGPAVAALDKHLVKTRRGVVSYGALKSRFARDTCFSDCYAKNGVYNFDHCWQYQPCYDNCIIACIDGLPINFNADVAALDDNLTKYPTEFKCYMRMPTGCDRPLSETSEPKKWFIDAGKNGFSGNSGACKNRRAIFNQWCQRSDAESQFRGVKPEEAALDQGGAENGQYRNRNQNRGRRIESE